MPAQRNILWRIDEVLGAVSRATLPLGLHAGMFFGLLVNTAFALGDDLEEGPFWNIVAPFFAVLAVVMTIANAANEFYLSRQASGLTETTVHVPLLSGADSPPPSRLTRSLSSYIEYVAWFSLVGTAVGAFNLGRMGGQFGAAVRQNETTKDLFLGGTVLLMAFVLALQAIKKRVPKDYVKVRLFLDTIAETLGQPGALVGAFFGVNLLLFVHFEVKGISPNKAAADSIIMAVFLFVYGAAKYAAALKECEMERGLKMLRDPLSPTADRFEKIIWYTSFGQDLLLRLIGPFGNLTSAQNIASLGSTWNGFSSTTRKGLCGPFAGVGLFLGVRDVAKVLIERRSVKRETIEYAV